MLTTPPWVTCCCLAHSKGAGASSKQSLPSKNINKLFTHPILTCPATHSSPSSDSSADKFSCTVLGCLRSFKSKTSITHHLCTEHAQNPSHLPPLTAPSSSTSSELPIGYACPSSSLSLFFLHDRSQSSHNSLADSQADIGYEHNPDFSYYNDDNFVPSGLDRPHHNAMHLPSNHSPPSHDNSQPAHGTPPPVHLNQASDHNGTSGYIKWLYHPLINGWFF